MEVAAQAAAVLKARGHKKLRPVIAEGGQIIELEKPDFSTPEKWCAYYGLPIKRGIVTLYKALNDDYSSPRGISYAPGSKPQAPDWDDGKAECGGGLHFSPSPGHALEFHQEAQRFVGCPVKVSEIIVHPDGTYPQKVKAPRVHGECFEVDRHGEPVQSEAKAA